MAYERSKKEEQNVETLLLRQSIAERDISDKKYADKRTEKIVDGLITFILTAVLAALLSLVILK